MKELTAVVIGATGLTGNLLVEELLKDNDFKTVRTLVRTPIDRNDPKLEQRVVNFNDQNDYAQKFGEGDIIFCCVGTTQKKVNKDEAAYTKVDYDIPVNAADIGIAKGFKQFLIVSAIGADETSSNFYLSLKGKTENRLKQFPFMSIGIFQPSILNGNRKESRMGERFLQIILDLISFLLLGSLKKFRSIGANSVAKAMLQASKKQSPGIHYYRYSEMMHLVRN
ncbi:MAG: NAD(P)H-binding protein [Ginsengibacter sp.]